jgi:putative tryptophan/tyrosine transport system substrate-binding protein
VIDRRTFLAGTGAVLLAAPLVAEAQRAGKVYRIGLFHVGLDHVPPALHGLRQGLKDLGYEEDKTLRWDFRNLPDENAAQATAREFVREKVDVIVAFENQCVRAAKGATTEVPILFLHVLSDPVAEGFVQSLAHPGGNITGIFGDVLAKRVEFMKELIPRLDRLLLLFDPTDQTAHQELATIRAAATARTLQLVERPVVTQADIERVFTSAGRENVQAVIVVSGLVTKFPSLVIRLATERRLPVSGHRKAWAEQGALFSYGADYYSVGRIDAARLVDRILKGAKPNTLPVEQITRVELVINLKTAKALGLTIPPSLLRRADEVIQ